MTLRISLAAALFGFGLSLGAVTGRADTVLAPDSIVPAVEAGIPSYVPAGKVTGTLAGVTGMDSVEGMFKAWSDAFAKYHPGTSMTVVQRGVAPEERIVIGANAEEAFHPDDGPFEAKFGYAPFRIRICQGGFVMKSHVSAIGVFVSKANPIDQISLAQLDAIYSDARRRGYPVNLETWGQLGLGGEWADRPIHILGLYGRDDVAWYFRDMVDYDAPFKSSYRVPSDDMKNRIPVVAREMMSILVQDPGAIGFANFSYHGEGVKPLALVDEHGVISQPSFGEMVSGRYPLQRSLYIYVNRKPGTPLSPLLKEFFTFILSKEGQSLVHVDHYLPLTAAMAAVERAKLD